MTNVAHKDLTGVHLHEPKGVAAATAGKVYISDGAGSGVWTLLDIPTGLFKVTVTEFTSSGTWTKPADLFMARVTCIGSGGNGGGGASNTTGGSVSFGSHCSATGGAGGNNATGGAGGVGSTGNINLTGATGEYINTSATSDILVGGGAAAGWIGGDRGRGQYVKAAAASPSGGGGGGGCALKYILDVSLASTETVTINTAGQNNGYVLVEEFILV